jgi:hypothetical protein
MKFRLSITLILLSLFVSAVRGQSNCCEIVPGGSTTQGTTTTVPGAQGGSYTSTATQTTSVTCFNTSNSKPCSASNPPNNVVTATGTGQWSTALQRFVACNPSFMSSTDQAASGGATFTNDGTTWGSVDGNGNCVKAPTQPFTISTCPVVTCVPSALLDAAALRLSSM